jgi:hypothetical protein
VVQDAFDHCGKRRIDGVKALSNKVGVRRLSRPNEIAVPEVRYVSDVVTRWRRHPPEIGITIVLPNMNLFHQALRWQVVRPCSGWSEIMEARQKQKLCALNPPYDFTRHSRDELWNDEDNSRSFQLKSMPAAPALHVLSDPC